MKITFLHLFVLALSCSSSMAAEDWSRFRGPNGSGVSDAAELPSEFGPDKNVLWKTELPYSASSPVLADSVVFVTSYADEKLLTYSLDRSTGQILWKREIVRSRAAKVYPGNDPASPSPVTDGENVYAFFPDLGLVSYDAEGAERWRRPLGPFHTFYGMSASPILSGDLVLLVCDQQSGSFIIAVDKNDGSVRWKVDRAGMIDSWSTPILYTPAGGSAQVITLGSFRVDAYAVETGNRDWWIDGMGYAPVSGPVVHGEMLYVSVPDQTEFEIPSYGAQLQSFDENQDGRLSREEVHEDGFLGEHFGFVDPDLNDFIEPQDYQAAYDAAATQDFGVAAIRLNGTGDLPETNILWRHQKSIPYAPTPLLYQGVLYLVRDGGIVTALDPSTGSVHKIGRARGAIEGYYASPVAADNKVFLTSATGKVTVLKAGAAWEILALNDLGEDVLATPALADGRIYLRTREHLYCFGKPAVR